MTIVPTCEATTTLSAVTLPTSVCWGSAMPECLWTLRIRHARVARFAYVCLMPEWCGSPTYASCRSGADRLRMPHAGVVRIAYVCLMQEWCGSPTYASCKSGADRLHINGLHVALNDGHFAAPSVDLAHEPAADARLGFLGAAQQLGGHIDDFLVAVGSDLAQELGGWLV